MDVRRAGHQIWSFAGNTIASDVSQMFLQPFVAYTTASLWTLTGQSETTADWETDSPNRWNVPVNLTAAKLASFGTVPASISLGAGYFVVKTGQRGDLESAREHHDSSAEEKVARRSAPIRSSHGLWSTRSR